MAAIIQGEWTVKYRISNLANSIVDVTATWVGTVDAREVTWSRTLAKRDFDQDGKTLPQMRAEVEAEFMAMFEASLAKSDLERQITRQEDTMATELNAMEIHYG